MNKEIIVCRKNYFTYKENEYLYEDIYKVDNDFSQTREIIILEEELYSKHFEINFNKRKIISFIENKIKNEFPQSQDILYDYEENKHNNVLAIYSIKSGERIQKLCKGAINLKIIPIQFLIKSISLNLLESKINNFNILVEIYGCYYYVVVNNGLFNSGLVEKDKNLIVKRILETCDNGELYIFNKAVESEYFKDKFQTINIEIGDLIYERIYKKQGFHSRKVL